MAARLRKLGLTAYGSTEAEAVLACKKLFNKFVHTYRARGEIEKRLDQVGVEWHWADEYPEDAPAYEDTNRLFNDWIDPYRQPLDNETPYPVAA